MPGFNHSPLTDIQQIRNDLRDRYQEGFPIIKEFLQNADDAQASRLHIGWHYALPGIDHPLLHSPSLFVLNNGEFRFEDQKSIKHIGISAKAANATTIGKFGLGLKSVFHLCEAFFYLWSEHDTIEILNPWYDKAPPNHDNWELEGLSTIASNARQTIVERLEATGLSNWQNWFCLWIPLRQECHCERVLPIRNRYLGDETGGLETIFPLNSAHEISRTLPMLHHLKSVSAWNANEHGGLERLFEVNLDEDATRCRYRGCGYEIAKTVPGDALQGTISVTQQSEPHDCSYAGFEAIPDSPICRQLLRSDKWPSVISIDPESAAERQDREKADTHCAAYIVETPAEDEGLLRIQQAVFLPVGNPTEIRPCEGKSDFTLMLHGYFFPNAGRTDIEIPEDEIADAVNNETDVRSKWNYELFVKGTLPLVIPALERFVIEGRLAEEKVSRLTESLQKSDTFKQYRQFICREAQWVRRLNDSGAAWEYLDSSIKEILEIPLPPSSAPDRPDRVFPNLREIARQHVITLRGDPRLTAQKAATKWSPELLTQLLPDSPVEAVFGSRGMLRYLGGFSEGL